MQVRRGQIYFADLTHVAGSAQSSIIPVLIVQNDYGNQYATTTIVAPITTQTGKPQLPTRVEFTGIFHGLQMTVLAILDQPRTLDKNRLMECVGAVDERTMAQIEIALAVSFGLGHS